MPIYLATSLPADADYAFHSFTLRYATILRRRRCLRYLPLRAMLPVYIYATPFRR